MKFAFDKYKFYSFLGKDDKKTVAAVSTYAGKTVKGYAKCDPRDEFDETAGKQLAAARCNAKVAAKRKARAERKVEEAIDLVVSAQEHLHKMNRYLTDSAVELDEANKYVTSLEERM